MPTKTRDMSEAQFKAALAKHGITGPRGPLYYFHKGNVGISGLNANSDRRRDILAYLLQQFARAGASE